MAGKYWNESWNPIKVEGGGYHCTKCSSGCKHCWAEGYNLRFGNHKPYDNGPVEYVLDEKVLNKPLRTRKPTVFFVCDLCDLFHPQVPFEFVEQVRWTMSVSREHSFLVLTKRPEQLLKYFNHSISRGYTDWTARPNTYWGLTICNQDEADKKLPVFLQIPGHKWLSIEPCLGEINIEKYLVPIECTLCEPSNCDHVGDNECRYAGNVPSAHIEQVVVGGESGTGARPMHPDWARSLRDQCEAAKTGRSIIDYGKPHCGRRYLELQDSGVPFFFKQWGKWGIWKPIATDYQKRLRIVGTSEPLSQNTIIKLFPEHAKSTIPLTGWAKVGTKKAGRLLDGREHNQLIWRPTKTNRVMVYDGFGPGDYHYEDEVVAEKGECKND